MLKHIFVDHPRSVGETYFEHQRSAFGFAGSLLATGLICLAHGVVPALFQTTGSRRVAALHAAMTAKRRRVAGGDEESAFSYSI